MLKRSKTNRKRDIVPLNMHPCFVEDCDSRHLFGVRVRRKTTESYLGIFETAVETNEIVACPQHRDEVVDDLVKKARKREHMMARSNWKKKKRSRNIYDYNAIVNSGKLPTLSVSRQKRIVTIQGKNHIRLHIELEKSQSEDVIDVARRRVSKFNTEYPVLLTHNGKGIAVSTTTGEVLSKHTVNNADYTAFASQFSGISYANRELYPVRTSQVTGVNFSDVRELEEKVEDVIELYEFGRLIGGAKAQKCLSCGDSMSQIDGGHRVIIDGRQHIVLTHEECGCISGQLNRNIINRPVYGIFE